MNGYQAGDTLTFSQPESWMVRLWKWFGYTPKPMTWTITSVYGQATVVPHGE
jgi:hypothetical protein